MATIEVVPADRGRTRREFLDLPYRLHGDDPRFVPPLRRDQRRLFDTAHHPFFEHADAAFFLARRDGIARGRIEAIVNHAHNRYHGDRVGFFGALACADDPDVARALFDHAAAWLRERSMTIMRGPATHSTNEECGLLVEGFDDPPFVGMPYNPRYYVPLVEGAGFVKAKDLHTWEVDMPRVDAARLARFERLAERRAGVTVRPHDPRHYWAEARRLFAVYNHAWEKNWGFVPMTEREFLGGAAQLRPFIRRQPEGVLLAEVDGHAVGFCLGIIDANQALIHLRTGRLFPFGFVRLWRALRRADQARVVALGVRPEFRHRGADALLLARLVALGQRIGITRTELGWVLEDNDVMRTGIEAALGAAARRTRTHRLYDRPLAAMLS